MNNAPTEWILQRKITSLKDENKILLEVLESRDRVIVKLTEELERCYESTS